tara:strand:- start:9591 stop:11456 length:1866 start_codon:yes stop_codon:yes gene_type:complete
MVKRSSIGNLSFAKLKKIIQENSAAGGGDVDEAFKTITIAEDGGTASGDSSIVADAAEDSLTIKAGSNITITGDSSGDAITIASAAASNPSFVSSSGDLNIVGESTLESTLNVSGAISGAVGAASLNYTWGSDANNHLNKSGGAELNGNLYVSGTFTAGAFSPSTLTVSGEISGSDVLNIVGAATLESTLDVTGAINSAAGVSGSSMSASYAHFNNLTVNDAGTNTAKILGTGEISSSGPLNVVGATTLESTLNVSGAISGATGLASLAYVWGSDANGILNKSSGAELNGNLYVSGSIICGSTVFAPAFEVGAGTESSIDGSTVGFTSKKLFLLGNDNNAATEDLGLLMERAGPNKGMIFDESAEEFAFINTTDDETASGAVNIDSYVSLHALSGTFDGVLSSIKFVSSGEISGSGPLNVVGAATLENVLHVSGAVSGATSLAGLNIVWGSDADAKLNKSGGAELPGNLYVTGTIIGAGDVGLAAQFTASLGAYFGGNVGVGVSNPSYAVELPNNANASGQVKANGFVSYSSERFKGNIQTIQSPLETVEKLRGVSFNWIENGKKEIGLIAEEVSKVLPEIVSFEDNRPAALDYPKLTALLIECVKEQQRKIEIMEKKLDL